MTPAERSPSPDPPCTPPHADGVRAFVVRRGLAHVSGLLTLDFVDVSRRIVYGLLHIEDRLLRALSAHELRQSHVYIVETPDARLPGSHVTEGESLLSIATVGGEPVELRCGGFRTRLDDLRLVAPTSR